MQAVLECSVMFKNAKSAGVSVSEDDCTLCSCCELFVFLGSEVSLPPEAMTHFLQFRSQKLQLWNN